MIIDFHTHVFPDDMAHKTVKKMAEIASTELFTPGTQNGLIQSMAGHGVSFSVTQPVATKAEQVKSINNWTIEHRRPELIPFGAIHPDYPHIREELERLKGEGFKGVKLHPDYQAFYPMEDRLKPIYRTCVDLGLIILFHAGDDIGHPRPGHSLPRLLSQVHDEYPALRLVFAHMGGYEMWDQARKYLVGKNVFLDTSYTFPFLPKEQVIEIIRKHGAEQILLGSDSPWGDLGYDLSYMESLDITDQEKKLILGENAIKLLGLDS